MSQIEGQPVVEEQVPAVVEGTPSVEPEFTSEEERLFAEEFDRRAAEERGDEPVETPAIEVPEAGAPTDTGAVGTLPSETSAETPTGGTPPSAGEPPAWYNELTDEAKLAFDAQEDSINQLQWQYTAVHGRLAPVQAQVERLTRQLSEGQPVVQSIPGEQPTPTASTPTTDFESKEFLAFAADYPDEAKVIKATAIAQQAQVQRLEQQIGTLSKGFESVQATSNAQAQQAQLNILTERHPDWMQVRNSPQFDGWLKTQPASVQPLVNSRAATDCSYLLDRYKQDVYIHELSLKAGGTQVSSEAQVRADKTRQHRETLINTPTPNPQGGGVGVPGVTGAPQTAEELWVDEIERRLRAQRNQR